MARMELPPVQYSDSADEEGLAVYPKGAKKSTLIYELKSWANSNTWSMGLSEPAFRVWPVVKVETQEMSI